MLLLNLFHASSWVNSAEEKMDDDMFVSVVAAKLVCPRSASMDVKNI